MRAYRGGKRLHGGRRHAARQSVDLAHFDPAEPRDLKGRWFHGSSHEFKPGDLVLPRAVTGAKSWAEQVGYTGTDVSDPKRVYLTRNRSGAMDFGHYVYEVEPVGEVSPDPEYPNEWFTSDKALRVVRKVVDHNHPVDLAHFDPAEPRDPKGRWISTSWRGRHRPFGRLSEGTAGLAYDIESVMPDFYEHPEYYRTGDTKSDRESTLVLKAIRGRPEAEVTIYRALPKRFAGDGVLEGDWVTLSPNYARQHAWSQTTDAEPDWTVVSRKVKAKNLVSPGDSLNEFGFTSAVDLAHFDPAEPRDPHTGRWWKSGPVSGRAGDLFGRGLDALFPDYGEGRLPLVLVPWSPARRRKDEPMFNADLLRQASEDLVAVDPRSLHSTQPNVSLAGVRHYFEGKPGLFADKSNPGNQVPVIYRRARTGENIILAGHHRAAAALLKGEPLMARYVEEPAAEQRTIAELSPTGHGNDWTEVVKRLQGTKPVQDYRAALRRGEQLPPIRLGGTKKTYVTDGHHRIVAALLEGRTNVNVDLSKSEKPTPPPGEPGGPGHVDLANPSIRRTRYVTKQLFDSHDPVTLLHHRGFSVPVAQAVAGLVDPRTGGTVTRPNLPRKGVALNLPMRIERDREALYRGGYILKAAERIQAAVDKGTPLADAVENERRFYAAHEKARRGRLEAVVKAQIAGRWSGEPVRVNGTWRTLVGWNLDPLINNDTECKIANGHNFYAEEGTLIGFPGGVHPNCGCWAGPPFAGAGLVNDALRGVTSLEQRPKYVLSRKRKTA